MAESDRLVGQLETTRSSMRRFRTAEGLVFVALLIVGLLWLLGLADWAWVVRTFWRGAGLAAIALAAAFLMGRRVLGPGPRFGREQAAEEVEAAFPKLGQRVRTTLEYAEPTPNTAPAAPGLIQALATDTNRRTRGLDFQGLVPWPSLYAPAAALAGLVVLALAALVGLPEARIAALRLLLRPAHYTSLRIGPGDQTLKAGSPFTVEATLSGRPVREVIWNHRRAGDHGPWTASPLAPKGSEPGSKPPLHLSGTLTGTLTDCRDNLEYRVVAGEVSSPTYHLKVVHPLTLKSAEADIEPPVYTRKPRTTQKGGDLKVIEGSRIAFRFSLDRTPATAALHLKASAKDLRSIPLTVSGSTLVGHLDRIDTPTEYRIEARADDGMELEPRTFKIRVQADQKPTIRFVKPPENLAVIATTEIGLRVDAADDFGVARVGIVYQIGEGPKETLMLKGFDDEPISAELLATLYLEKHKVDFTDGLTYHAFAEDNRPVRPNRATTELRFIDILPFQQAFQMKEGGGACSGQCLSLDELIGRQRVNLNRTFAQSEEPAANPEIIRRLEKAEQSLAETTAGFTAALESRFGPIPTLHEAIAAMETATSALGRIDAKASIPPEEVALAHLIKARKNLRKLLSDKATAGICRAIDRQQQMKLRLPPRKPDDSLAKLPQDIRALAQEERKIGEACQIGSNPSQDLANRQEKAAEAAQTLRKTVRDDPSLSDLARARMDAAAESVRQGSDAIRQGRTPEASRQTTSAANQLDRLAAQVAGLKAAEMAAKLAAARDLADALAREQKTLGDGIARGVRSGQADAERGIAEGSRTLGDWLARFQSDAADDSRDLSRSLSQAGRANPPGELAEDLDRLADQLDAGQGDPVAARDAANRLAALAQTLESIRRAYVQPRLDQLVAAEKQAARTQDALQSARDEAGKGEAEKAMTDLLRTLESLKTSEAPLAQAIAKLAESLQAQGSGWGKPQATPGTAGKAVLSPPRGYSDGVGQVLLALQAKIQELILRDILQDRDEGVPPRYKTLVDEYYRVLSQDLR